MSDLFKSNLPKDFETGKRYTPIQTEKQRLANVQRNKDRWDTYDEEFRKAWGEKSSKDLKAYWDSLSDEERAARAAIIQESWDNRSDEDRESHAMNAQAWRNDPDKVARWREISAIVHGWRDAELYREIYYKTLSIERYAHTGLYKRLAEEYNIPYATVSHVAINIRGHIDPKEHAENMQKLSEEWTKHKEVREEERQQKMKENQTRKFWFDWEFYSPGKGSEELYDYYNSMRTANQKMPVPPSLVYYFREQNFKAKDIKQFCKENGIYESDDNSYWHKLAKFKYPWYSTEKSICWKFSNTEEASEFASKTFNRPCTGAWLYGKAQSGLQKFGTAKGWIIRKVRKEEQ